MKVASFIIKEQFGFNYETQIVNKVIKDINCSKSFILTDSLHNKLDADFKVINNKKLKITFLDSLKAYEVKRYILVEKENTFKTSNFIIKKKDSYHYISNGLVSIKIPKAGLYNNDIPGPILDYSSIESKGSYIFEITNIKSAIIKTKIERNKKIKLEIIVRYLIDDTHKYVFKITMYKDKKEILISEEFSNSNSNLRVKTINFTPRKAFVRMHTPSEEKGKKSNEFERLYFNINSNTNIIAKIKPFFGWGKDESPLVSLYDNDNVLSIAGAYASNWENGEENKLIVDRFGIIKAPINKGKRQWVISLNKIDEDKNKIKKIDVSKIGYQDNLTGFSNIDYIHNVEKLSSIYNGANLNKYSNWIFEYEGLSNIEYPSLLIRKDDIVKMRENLDKFTWFSDVINKYIGFDEFLDDKAGYYLATNNATIAKELVINIEKWFDTRIAMFKHFGYAFHDLVAIAFTRPFRNAVIDFDLIASEVKIDNSIKTRIMKKIIYLLYCMQDNDYWPDKNKTNFGKGNVNFHSDYFTSFGIAACITKEHPKQSEWIQYAKKEFVKDLKRCINSDYAFVEAPNYQAYTLMYYSFFIQVYKNNNIYDFFTNKNLKNTYKFLANIQTPKDPRMKISMIPSLGDTDINYHTQQLQVVFAYAAKFTKDTDKAFSREMMSAFKRAGEIGIVPMVDRNCAFKYGLCLVDIFLDYNLKRKWHDLLYEGFGTISRTKDEKGYLVIKSGYIREHYDHDEGTMIFYANEIPILIDYGSQYNPPVDQSFMHNRISIKDMSDVTHKRGRVDLFVTNKKVSLTSFTHNISTIQKWPKWPPRDKDFSYRLLENPITINPVAWNRDVIYIKEWNTLYIRDYINGEEKTQFNLHFLAKSSEITDEYIKVVGKYNLDTYIYLHNKDIETISLTSWSHEGLDELRCQVFDGNWRDYDWIYKDGLYKGDERSEILTILNKSKNTTYSVLVSSLNEPLDNVEFSEDGKVVILKHKNITKIIFSSVKTFEFKYENIHFKGNYGLLTIKNKKISVDMKHCEFIKVDGKYYD